MRRNLAITSLPSLPFHRNSHSLRSNGFQFSWCSLQYHIQPICVVLRPNIRLKRVQSASKTTTVQYNSHIRTVTTKSHRTPIQTQILAHVVSTESILRFQKHHYPAVSVEIASADTAWGEFSQMISSYKCSVCGALTNFQPCCTIRRVY